MTEMSLLTPAPGAPEDNARAARAKLEEALTSGAKWFYWIAGLSLVNSLTLFTGSGTRFVIGLGITQVVDYAAKQAGAAGGVIHLGVNLIIVGLFVMFGYQACQRSKAAFLTGMIVYVLDAGLLLLAEDFLSVGFHGFALFFIFKGFSANNQLRAMEEASVAAGLSSAPLKPE